MKQNIANWLRDVADWLTGEQTVDIVIAKEFDYWFNTDDNSTVVELSKRALIDRETEWVRESIIKGVRKASYEGAFRWWHEDRKTGAKITARLRIIKPGPQK